MSQKFYISDLHLGHKTTFKFDRRPFNNLQEMEKTIIRNWNNTVGKSDDVYILGDMIVKKEGSGEILDALNGNKFLIRGNHDRINAEMKERYIWIKDYAEIKDNGRHVVLCHYPIAHWKNADYGTIHLHGHIHAGRDSRPFEEYKALMKQRGINYECYNVAAMFHYMNYTPRTLDEIQCRN